jgi:hypothetical protein
MRVSPDESKFDSLQEYLIGEIVTAIRDGLQEAGISDDQALYEATGSIAFSIAAIVDGSRIMELEGERVVPVLTFANSRDAEELISASAGGSWMHEYVFATVDEVFEFDEGEEEDANEPGGGEV